MRLKFLEDLLRGQDCKLNIVASKVLEIIDRRLSVIEILYIPCFDYIDCNKHFWFFNQKQLN